MRTLPYDLDIFAYLTPIIQAVVSLKSNPVTAPLAAEMLPLRDEWKTVLLQEIQLQENVAEADASVFLIDFDLDGLFNAIVNALLTAVNNDRSHRIFVRFLGNDRPADIRAPILGEELERLRTWPPGLAAVPSDEVKKYGAALADFVPKADAAVAAQTKASQELTDFTQLGPRKVFVDHLNAVSKRLYGKLSELMHTPAGASLPPDFPDRCFPPETRARRPTLKSEERTVERLKAQLQRHEAILADLKAQEQASQEARDAAERAALEDEASTLKKETEQRLARIAEIEAKLGKKPAGAPLDG